MSIIAEDEGLMAGSRTIHERCGLKQDFLSVVSQFKTLGQAARDLGMAANVVVGVDKESTLGIEAAGEGNGIVDQLVGVVGLAIAHYLMSTFRNSLPLFAT